MDALEDLRHRNELGGGEPVRGRFRGSAPGSAAGPGRHGATGCSGLFRKAVQTKAVQTKAVQRRLFREKAVQTPTHSHPLNRVRGARGGEGRIEKEEVGWDVTPDDPLRRSAGRAELGRPGQRPGQRPGEGIAATYARPERADYHGWRALSGLANPHAARVPRALPGALMARPCWG
jgi:hypothetical protein